MTFFNETLSFEHISGIQDFWGLNYDEFLSFLDGILAMSYGMLLGDNLNEAEMILRSPMHCVVASNGEIIIIGISNDKALRGQTILSAMNESASNGVKKDELIIMLNNMCKREIGYIDNIYMSFDVKIFKNELLKRVLRSNRSLFAAEYMQELQKLQADAKKEPTEEKVEILHRLLVVWKEINRGTCELTNNIKKRVNLMDANPKFKARDMVVKENQAFYVLPFTEGPLNAYDAVKNRMEKNDKVNCNIIKSEDTFDPNRGNNIVENIWQDICTSRFIIADLSEKNPNVFYELGICDTLGKKVISICSNKSRNEDYGGKLPFDIAGDYTIFYDEDYKGITLLQDQIEQRISAILNNSVVRTN